MLASAAQNVSGTSPLIGSPEHAVRGTLTLSDYARGLTQAGTRVVSGSSGTLWVRHEIGAMVRTPAFRLDPVETAEIRRVLWQGRAGLVSFALEPDDAHPVNASLYLCTDHDYRAEKLLPAMRRNLKRAARELTVRWLTPQEVLRCGVRPFCDTRRRAGLSDATPEHFLHRFGTRVTCRGHVFLGAWKGDTLAGFLSMNEVEDWVEIEGCFSTDALLETRPNDILMYRALSQYLVEERRRLVSYGASSIQPVDKQNGLHVFKMKVGFEACPIHRAFILHPLLRPFANRLTQRVLNAFVSLRPSNRSLLKATGVLNVLMRSQQPLVVPVTRSGSCR